MIKGVPYIVMNPNMEQDSQAVHLSHLGGRRDKSTKVIPSKQLIISEPATEEK